jgi:hypothetical protein
MWRRTRLVNDTHGSAIAKIHSAFIFTWTFWVTPQRIGTIGAWLPGGVWVGWGVPEVLAAFVTTPATMCGNHDDRALRPKSSSSGSTEKNRTGLVPTARILASTSGTLEHQESIAESVLIVSKYSAEFENTCSYEFLSMSTL